MSNKYFEEYTPEEYKQLAVALTLANAKLQDMYMMKTHSDFQILQSRITEQVNKAEALRQIQENELTLNPKVVSYLFNSPAQAQQQAQQQLQQIQNPAPVGIPALAPVVEGEQKDEAPDAPVDGEQKADAPDDVDDEEKQLVYSMNTNMDSIGYAKSLERAEDKINEADENELREIIERTTDDLSLIGLSENVRKLLKEEKKKAEKKLNDIQLYDTEQVNILNDEYENVEQRRELNEQMDKINNSSYEDVIEILQNSKDILQRFTDKGLSDKAIDINKGIVRLAEKRLLRDDKPAVPAPKKGKKTRADWEKEVREQLGDVPNLGQSGMVNKDMLIEILEQNMTFEEADDFIKRGKQTKEQIKKLKERLIQLDAPATPVLIRTPSAPLSPRPTQSRPAINIPVLADEGKTTRKLIKKTEGKPTRKSIKKTEGKGLKYKKTPKKLLMVGSAHAGNNNKKMLKMLKRKK